MNIQEIDKWLDNEYGMSYTKLEELHNYFFEKYTNQKEEIERLNNIIKEQVLEDKPNYYVKGLEGSLKEYQEEVKRLNNIIKRLEEDLREMYLTFGEFSEEYTENKIKELKGEDKE